MAAGEEAPADLCLSGRRTRGARPIRPGNGCSVELTEVQAVGGDWWTLGFEARGRGALGGIKRAAATVFDEPPPMTPAFEAEEAMSYAEWINELVDGEGR